MTIPEVLFSFRGRLCRYDYWVHGMLILFPIGIFNDILMFATDNEGAHAIAMIIGLASIWPGVAMLWKRWHDRGRSAWWLLTLLIPFLNLIFMFWIVIEVWFLKGTDGPNEYGPDPLQPEVETT
jgi:uncharacterized membrane protein YhaH (DUF805 family)